MIQGLFGSGLASRIDDKHWQGGFPDPSEWSKLSELGFGALVLCAEELQPGSNISPGEDRNVPEEIEDYFPGIDVICAPMDDANLSLEEAERAIKAAKLSLRYLQAGRRVLVTCAMGRNRSGLVSALILVMRRGISGEQALTYVQQRRPNALTNRTFATFLKRIGR